MERDTVTKIGAVLLFVSALALTLYYSRPLPPSGKTVVRFLTYETGPAQMALTNEIKRRFEAENPDIEVQIEFNATARDKVYVEMASGTSPDTFYVVTDAIPRLAMKGAIEPLSAWYARDKTITLKDYFPKVVQALRYAPPAAHIPKDEQELWAAPIHFSTNILFYNKKLFDEAGVPYPNDSWTWDDMVRAAQKLTKRDAQGRVTQFGLFVPEFVPTILSNGAHIFNSDFTRSTIAGPRVVEAVQKMRDLRFKYKVAPNPAEVQGTSSTQMFKMGQLAMLPGRTWMTVDFNKITDFTYDVALTPPMRRRVDALAVGGMCMSRRISPSQKQAAWRWMKFFTSRDGGQQLLGREKNCVTAVEDFAWSKKYFMQAPPRNCRPYVTSLDSSVLGGPPWVCAPVYNTAIMAPAMDNILRDPSVNIAATLKQCQDETNALLAQEPKRLTAALTSE